MRRPALTVLIVALLAACSAESAPDDNDAVQGLSTAEVRGTTTTVPVSTTAAAGCSGTVSGLPQTATDVSEGLGDFDGNGSVDQLIAYSQGGSRPWRLVVVLADGGDLELGLEEVGRGERVQAVGGVDLDGERGEEALAVIGSDSSVTLVGVFRLVDCELVQAEAQNGDPAALFVGGSSREGVGVSCGEGSVVQLKAESSGGRTYATTRTILQLDGDTLRAVGAEPGPVLTRGRDDEELERYYSFNCGTLGLGPQGAGVTRDRGP